MFGTLLLIAAAHAADPLAEARAGKLQCVSPNVEAKKCLAIASYVVRPDGSFDTVVTLMIAPSPLIAMETRASGKAEGEALCSIVRKSDYEASKYTIDGKPADAATASAITAQILGTVAAMDGKKACSIDRPDTGDLMVEEVTLDGVARPDMTQKFIWVKPEDGYTVGQ
ncbi:hypothetical protein [Sphingomonas sp. dw_22]|uniref:hypothetical protein n=1 Tax=Sphingomonas sp. dw_22 TaxID=2721175 RepID=UPI001BD594EE|nr:hypothetical protein [Sphingomonas sp. dw_22]